MVTKQMNQVSRRVIASPDGVPEWIQLTPGPGTFEGRDGRRFALADAEGVVSEFNASGQDIQVDLDHKSELPGMLTDEGSRAVGWVVEMSARSGEVWGKVEWTEEGAELVRGRKYRSVSPVFHVAPGSQKKFQENSNPMRVTGFASVALTNRPNLHLLSLNAVQPRDNTTMPSTKILAALGLDEGADEARALNAIAALKTAPDLSQYIPKADYVALNAKLTRMEAAETARREAEEKAAKERHETEVNAALDEAVKAGKVAPASKDFYRAGCATAEGLAAFKAEMNSRAPIVVPGESGEAPSDDSANISDGPTDADRELARNSGLTVEEVVASRKQLGVTL